MVTQLQNKRKNEDDNSMNSGTYNIEIVVLALTSLPAFCRNSISAGVKLVIDIDFTRCCGFNPRLKLKHTDCNELETTIHTYIEHR